ncbi:hypothetical protein NL676_018924 [Syzygium grande]|nr:hypothetical protein NL676_018924 [Syzygium grande]
MGPILKIKVESKKGFDIPDWLNQQPDASVVFLCFGSHGSFNEDQAKEIARALERSKYFFLWSLRWPPAKGKLEASRGYTDLAEALPEGFLNRTARSDSPAGPDLRRRLRPPAQWPPPAGPDLCRRLLPPTPWPPPAQEQPAPPVPTSAVASSRPRVAGSRALTAVASTAKLSLVLLPNGRGWGSGGGLFSVDFVGLCCKSKRTKCRLGVSCSRGLPAPPLHRQARAAFLGEGGAPSRAGRPFIIPAASRLVRSGTSFR